MRPAPSPQPRPAHRPREYDRVTRLRTTDEQHEAWIAAASEAGFARLSDWIRAELDRAARKAQRKGA